MAIVFLIVLAVAAFWFWSVNGAKKQRKRFLIAVARSIEDQVRNTPRLPSWHRSDQMRDLLAESLAPVPSQLSPFDPAVVKQWLDASLTWDDIFTFMHHAENAGFSPIEQIALAPDAAKAFLAQDLAKASTIVDKMIMLHLVTATKVQSGQELLKLEAFSYPLVQRFFLDFGAKDDATEEFEAYYWNCEFPFRDGTFPADLEVSDDPKAVPTILVFSISPPRAWAAH